MDRDKRKNVGAQFMVRDAPAVSLRHGVDNLRDAASGNPVVIPFADRGRRNAQQPRKSAARAAHLKTTGERGINHSDVLQLRLTFNKASNVAADVGAVDRNRYSHAMISPKVKSAGPVVAPDPAKFNRFGDWVRAVCEQRRGMQRTLAKIAGVKPSAVNLWIKGRVRAKKRVQIRPGRNSVYALATSFNVSSAALLELAGCDNAAGELPPPSIGAVETARLLDQWQRMQGGSGEHAAVRHAILETMHAANQVLAAGDRFVMRALVDAMQALARSAQTAEDFRALTRQATG